jgi:ribosome-associated protein
MQIFELGINEYIELNKLLKVTGLAATGSEANHCIDSGRVKVNELAELQRRKKLRKGDKVQLENHTIIIQ